MWHRKEKEKTLRMVWEIQRQRKTSFLVGTAHFFPYSFRTSLRNLMERVHSVFLEGPLDDQSMKKATLAGACEGDCAEIINSMDQVSLTKVIEIFLPKGSAPLQFLGVAATTSPRELLISQFKQMKPWLMFFTIYKGFLDRKGWKHSVDLEAYQLAKELHKGINFLETMEEQIEALENMSVDQISDFLNRIDNWDEYIADFTKWYLDGELQSISSNPYKFPTRSTYIIQRRDSILCDRMVPLLERGNVAIFVGIPHVLGITRLLLSKGFSVGQILI